MHGKTSFGNFPKLISYILGALSGHPDVRKIGLIVCATLATLVTLKLSMHPTFFSDANHFWKSYDPTVPGVILKVAVALQPSPISEAFITAGSLQTSKT